MEINLTVCIQLINFSLFYYGISRFFLRPFVDFIQKKNLLRQQILDDFATKEGQLKSLVHARSDMALQFKQMLKENYALPAIQPHVASEDKSPVLLDERQRKAIITHSVARLVTRIRNAY